MQHEVHDVGEMLTTFLIEQTLNKQIHPLPSFLCSLWLNAKPRCIVVLIVCFQIVLKVLHNCSSNESFPSFLILFYFSYRNNMTHLYYI